MPVWHIPRLCFTPNPQTLPCSDTIVHPGGLTDEEGGKRELVVDVDDNLISRQGNVVACK